MIFTNVPYCPQRIGQNLGYAYNRFMCLLPGDDDYAFFIDHDAMPTTARWYEQLEHIAKRDHVELAFVSVNRCMKCQHPYQIPLEVDTQNHDMRYHRRIGRTLEARNWGLLQDVTFEEYQCSGTGILIKKSAWREIQFAPGFLGVDTKLHTDFRDMGKKVFLMKGVYFYHWYRGDGDTTHLNKKDEALV